ncbi:hypothetical protein [Arcanobacterium hippocoleae]|uniref:hypothetical protein n=1 Tax=Arcanobacterium hippocoleae TaxID=149017 RepID=UPI00334105DB
MNKKIISVIVALIGGITTFLTALALNYLFPTENPIREALPAAVTVAVLLGVLFFVFASKNKE